MNGGNELISKIMADLRLHRTRMQARGYDIDDFDRGYAMGQLSIAYINLGADAEAFKAANAEIIAMGRVKDAA